MLHSSVKVHGNLWTRLRGAGGTRLWRRGGSSRSGRAPAARVLPGMRPRLGPQHVGDRRWRPWEGVAPLGGLQSRGGWPPGRLRAQRTEMAAGSVTRPVRSASAVLSDSWSQSKLAGCRGEDAASVHVSCSVFLRQDGEAVVVVALGGALRDAARGVGDPARWGAACVA